MSGDGRRISLDPQGYALLCQEAAQRLRITDAEAVGTGRPFASAGVWCRLAHRRERGCAVLTCDLGDPAPGTEAVLHRTLLEIQSQLAGQADAMFICDPLSGSILFAACLPLGVDLHAAEFVAALESVFEQVRNWRGTLMKGQYPDEPL